MTGYGDSDTPADQQVQARGDSDAPANSLHVQSLDGAAGVQVGSGNVQINNIYIELGQRTPHEHARTRQCSTSEAETAVPGQAPQAADGRDRHVADRDQCMLTADIPPGQPRAADGPCLGRRLFSARIPRNSGRLSVAFGAEGTLIVAGKDTTVHRWSLASNAPLPGAPAGAAPRFSVMRSGTATRMAASTITPAVAVSRGARLTLLHFSGDAYRAIPVPLGAGEYLAAADSQWFATYDGRRVAVRDFADGSVIWQTPAPRNLATATVSARGTTVAMAGSPNLLAPSNQVIVATKDDPSPRCFPVANFPAAGCQLGISPEGELVACASFREIIVACPRTGKIVRQKQLGGVREDVLASLGTGPHRLICTNNGDLFWFRGQRTVNVNWSADKSRYLPQDGLCDDIAFDHENSRLAMASESGQIDVYQWTPAA
jgi:hypothetical protein